MLEESAIPYKVHLEMFEGPLDLLLHLIKKEDLDIYDIPISRLLAEYLEYLKLAHEVNIDLAGEFLEMASELTLIKSRMLLPEPLAQEEEGPDPRAELVQRLLEYQRYKMAAGVLMERPLLGRDVFARRPEILEEEPGEIWIEADSISLLSAFQDLLKKLPKEQFHQIREVTLGVAEKVLELTERLQGKKQVDFEDLFREDFSRGELIVTFLAILEMGKQGLIRIIQERVFHKIYVVPLFSDGGESDGA